jgi:hypothetical protein
MTRTPIPLSARPWRRARVLLVALVGLLVSLVGCASPRVAPVANTATPPAPASPGTVEPATRDEHSATVALLASPSFGVRAKAARALLVAGDDALPALGRAGDMPVRVDGGMRVSATTPVVRSLLGSAEDAQLLEHLGSPWQNVRREAAGELGRRDRWAAVPRLIDHLEDGDAEVRAASASALRRVTNNFFGYRAQASLGQRRIAADRWRTWWSQEGRARAREHELGAKVRVPGAASAATRDAR